MTSDSAHQSVFKDILAHHASGGVGPVFGINATIDFLSTNTTEFTLGIQMSDLGSPEDPIGGLGKGTGNNLPNAGFQEQPRQQLMLYAAKTAEELAKRARVVGVHTAHEFLVVVWFQDENQVTLAAWTTDMKHISNPGELTGFGQGPVFFKEGLKAPQGKA